MRTESRIEFLERQLNGLRAQEARSKLFVGMTFSGTASERVIAMLSRYPQFLFTPAELATGGDIAVETVRQALKRLRTRGIVRHPGYGQWGIST